MTRRAAREAPPRAAVSRRRMAVAALAATAALVVVVAVAPSSATFVVRDTGTGEALYTRPVDIGEHIRIEHTHSVTRRLVVERISVKDRSTLAMEELWFDRHGANLPTGSERIGEVTTTYVDESNGYRVLHHGREIGTLPLIVGSEEVDHVLVFEDGERVHLLDIADRWARVELLVGRVGR